jgi:PilZ domain
MKMSDRRLAQRFPLAIPLFIREWNTLAPEWTAESVNISECGVYFETDTPPREGAMVQIRMQMPEKITGAAAAEWRCTGKVMGVQPAISLRESTGVRVRFDYYEVVQALSSIA